MKKKNQLLSAVALSVGLSLSASFPASAALPSQVPGQEAIPSLAPMLEKVLPAVVSVQVEGTARQSQRIPEELKKYFGEDAPDQQAQPFEGLGSGVIIDAAKGYILTNNHVISQADKISVQLNDGREFDAKLIGGDDQSDIALLQVQNPSNLTQIASADSDKLRVGDFAVAVGNPFGLGQTATSGIVSALGRSGLNLEGLENFIQTDASINRGNSGGALLNLNGELIGINEAKYSSTQVEGMGFAIPISKAEPILQNLMNLTTRYKVSDDEAAYIGINMADVSADVSQNYGIPTGVCIMSVVDGSPAADAGFKKGDVITTFDGRSISNAKGLKETLTYYAAGETVDVTVQRADNGEYKEVTLTLTLGSAADMPQTSGSSNGTTNDGTGSSDQNDQGIQNPFGNR